MNTKVIPHSGPPEGTEPILRAAAVAAWLGCSVDTVYRYAREESLPFVRLGGGRKGFLRSKVQQWIDHRESVIHKAPEEQGAEAGTKARDRLPRKRDIAEELKRIEERTRAITGRRT
jgi:excisionase family DNA binding protein